MPYSGSTYSAPSSSWNPAVSSTTISPADWNTLLADLSTALSSVILANGAAAMTGDLAMGSNKITGMANATTRTGATTAGQIQDGALVWAGTAGGTADALTLTLSPAITAYATNMRIGFKVGAANNTTAVTIAVNGLATKAGQINGIALKAGDLVANKYYQGYYDGTAFQISRLGMGTPLLNPGYTTTATAAATTTLTVDSTGVQFFTGITTQTVAMPVASTLTLGQSWGIVNNSTGVVTVQSSGANSIVAMVANSMIVITCILVSGTDAASWSFKYAGFGAVTGTGSAVLATSPTLVTPLLGTPTSGALSNCTSIPVAQATGNLPVANLGSGTGATSSTFWRGDGSWHAAGPTLSTPQVTTSGTAFDFTGIPAGTKQIDVLLNGVSLNGTDNLLIQIGDSGGIETNAYTAKYINWDDAGTFGAAGTGTAGCLVYAGSAVRAVSGTIRLRLENSASFTWVMDGTTSPSGAGTTISFCIKATSAELDRVRLTRTGTDTFDAGEVNIQYL